jgi:hypothetical protein
MKKYYIHDNGSRPFLVECGEGKIQVFGATYDKNDYENVTYEKKVYETKYTKLFIGTDPKHPKFKGNSILVHVNGCKYVSIGAEIYEFITNGEKISKYYSPVGNSDVPYPYAIGDTNTYLLCEKVYLDNIFLPKSEDPYDIYYQEHQLKISLVNAKHLKTPKNKIEKIKLRLKEIAPIMKAVKKIKSKTLVKRLL